MVIDAWELVNEQPSFWKQCTVRFDAVGRKKQVTVDLMLDWVVTSAD